MIKDRLKELRTALNLSQEDVADAINSKRSTVSGYERGISLPDSDTINAIVKEFNVNIKWLVAGEGNMFDENSSNDPLLDELDKFVRSNTSTQFTAQEKRIQELEAHQQRMQDELTRLMELYSSKDTGLPLSPSEYRIKGSTESETHQSAPAYVSDDEDELTERLPLALNLAAGIPREACDSGDTVAVPSRFLKKGHNYCVAKIAGTSMTEAGIQDGSHVLLEYSNEPKAGAIMVVKYGANTTLKLLHLTEGGTWELRYQDGSGAKVELKDYTWEVQGLFVRVLKP